MGARIAIRDNGPLLVDGEVTIVDADGTPFPLDRRPAALCRCGHSGVKPFCDGSHNREGFADATRAGGVAAGPDPAGS